MVRNYMVGRDLLGLQLYSGVRNADGTVTFASYGYLAGNSNPGSLDYFRVSDMRNLDMIASLDDTYENWEETLLGSSCVVGEILKKGDGTTSPGTLIAPFLQAYSYALVVATRRRYGSAGATTALAQGGTGGTTNIVSAANTAVYIYTGTIRSGQDGMTSHGKNTNELVIAPKNLGWSPLLYVQT